MHSKFGTFEGRGKVGQDRRNGTHLWDGVKGDVAEVGIGEDDV